MIKLFLQAFIGIFISSSAYAATTVPDICSVVLNQGIRDGYETISVNERFQLLKQRIISIKSETLEEFHRKAADAGFDIPLVDGMIGLSGNYNEDAKNFKSVYEKFSSSLDQQNSAFDFFRSRTSVANSSLVENWRKCSSDYLNSYMVLNQRGVFLDVTPYDNGASFEALITVRSDRLGEKIINAIHPDDDSVVCSTAGVKIAPGAKFSTSSFRITCKKSPSREIPFSVTTDEGVTNSVTVPAGTSYLQEIQQKVDNLSAQIDRLKLELSAEKNRISVIESRIPTKIVRTGVVQWTDLIHHGENRSCPENMVQVGSDFGKEARDFKALCGELTIK